MSKYRIREIMRGKNLTIRELAQKIGLNPVYLGQVLSERKNISVGTLDKIAAGLEVPVASLFSDFHVAHDNSTLCPYCNGRIYLNAVKP